MAQGHEGNGGAKGIAARFEAGAQPSGVLLDPGASILTREVVGNDVILSCRGFRVTSFRRGEGVERDVAIAALIRLDVGLTVNMIAELCEASHGWVCEVGKRLRNGGTAAVLAHAQPGPPRLLAGRKEVRLRDLHGEGLRPKEIGEKLGVSPNLIRREIKRLGLLPRGWAVAQQGLPGVGTGATGPKKRGAAEGERAPQHRSDEPNEEDPPAAKEDGEDAGGPNAPAKGTSKVVDTGDVEDIAQGEHAEPADAAEGAAPSAGEIAGEVESTVAAVQEASKDSPSGATELMPGARIPCGPFEHPCRYAGLLLLCAATTVIGVTIALEAAKVARPKESVYDAREVLLALIAAWGGGYGSLESMHERDAGALGVILDLERCPSVRTMHRGIAQMSASFDPVALDVGLMRGLLSAHTPERLWFGTDGHFKVYSGAAPIDKGWDSKRRIASKGLLDVMITDEEGWTWQYSPVAAGDALSKHLLSRARMLRGLFGDARPIVLASDRGGFDFDVLNPLDANGFYYVGYVPASVSLPDLSRVAPRGDGIGEELWDHRRLRHKARLIVERDGDALIPIVSNLPTLVSANEVVDGLGGQRGVQENSFKAGRAFANIDALVDRGGATLAPDDRAVPNPTRISLKSKLREVEAQLAVLKGERLHRGGRSHSQIDDEISGAQFERDELRAQLRATPAKVPRVTIDPSTERATLKTRNRLLLQPLKFAADNARRWLLDALGSALAPTDNAYDQSALPRTLVALLDAPGTVRFEKDLVRVTVDFPLPPTSHQRISRALEALDDRGLRFTDGCRHVIFRLAPRPTRETLLHHV